MIFVVDASVKESGKRNYEIANPVLAPSLRHGLGAFLGEAFYHDEDFFSYFDPSCHI